MEIRSKFTAEVDAVFSGLPKPKDPVSFTNHDLPLLFTANDVQQFALEHRLNKAGEINVKVLLREPLPAGHRERGF